jgi:hypothetical protein
MTTWLSRPQASPRDAPATRPDQVAAVSIAAIASRFPT